MLGAAEGLAYLHEGLEIQVAQNMRFVAISFNLSVCHYLFNFFQCKHNIHMFLIIVILCVGTFLIMMRNSKVVLSQMLLGYAKLQI